MQNVNVDALNETITTAERDPSALKQHVSFSGKWQSTDGAPRFARASPCPTASLSSLRLTTRRRWVAPASHPTRSPTASGAAWRATR